MKWMAERNLQNHSGASQVHYFRGDACPHFVFHQVVTWAALCLGWVQVNVQPPQLLSLMKVSKSIMGSKGNWSKSISQELRTTREGKTGLKLTLSEMEELLFLCLDTSASWWLSENILRQYLTLRGFQTGLWRCISLKIPYKCPAASAWNHTAFRVVLI